MRRGLPLMWSRVGLDVWRWQLFVDEPVAPDRCQEFIGSWIIVVLAVQVIEPNDGH